MKKISIVTLLLIIAIPVWSQTVQWGYKILDYSSEKSSKEYAAVQALGKHNVLPANGENIKSWQPKDNAKESYIKVGFLTPVIPKQIIIAESLNPGYISSIYVYDAEGKEHKIATTYKNTKSKSRFLHINTNKVNFFVLAVKIVLQHENTAIAIDAIGITEYEKPYRIKINPNDVIKANMVVSKLSTNVNSEYPEMGPLVSPDGKTLFFSRSGDPLNAGGKRDQEDILYATWEDTIQNWGQAKNIGKPLNNKDPNFIIQFPRMGIPYSWGILI